MADIPAFAEANGWKLCHSIAFADVYHPLLQEGNRLSRLDPEGFERHLKSKILANVIHLIYDEIPNNPNAAKFLQGNTIGPTHRHWRRAKFMQRFRLFFRFDSATRVIVYGWLNDENTLRKAGSRTDPYSVFLRRLDRGTPPDDWAALLKDAAKALKTKKS
jgi:toxin YhaV